MSIATFLGQVSLAPRQAHKTLSVWPLVRHAGAPHAEYALLADALARGDALVDEVGEHGTVPHVRVVNRGATALLVLFGEELRGAKQNRIANASFLVAPESEGVIDVACVEQGRWARRRGAAFAAGHGVVSSAIRRKLAARVTASREAGHGFRADQGEVWDDVRERVFYSRADSSTGAYADYEASRKHDLEEICGSFAALPGQVGFVAALGDEVVGLEAIGREEVFAAAFLRLLRGYAIDAVDAALVRARAPAARAPRFDAPEDFLTALAAAEVTSGPSLGLGADLRARGAGVAACALALDGELVHGTAFPELA